MELSGAALRRWKLGLFMAVFAAFFMVFGYFTIRATLWHIASPERIRAFSTAVIDHAVDWADRMVRGEAAVREQAQIWTDLPTELQDVEMNVIALSPTPTRAGAMTRLDGNLLLATTGAGRFVLLDADTAHHGPAAIASPINLAEFTRDPSWYTPGLNRKHFRVNDILAIRKGEGAYTLYASHYWFTPKCIEFRLSRTEIVLEKGQVRQRDAWQRIFTATPCFPVLKEYPQGATPFSGHLSGGRMLDFDARHLMMTVGDQQAFEARGVDVSQDPSVTMGKILLVDKETGATSIFASGQRNAQGLMRDSTGRIWETEHGPRGGDELNLVHQGDNLGWPRVTYGMNYDLRPWPGTAGEGRHDGSGFVKPVFAWVPSIGVTALVEAPGDAFPNWKGDLLVGSLRGTSIFRVRLEGDRVAYVEQIGLFGRAVRDLEVLTDGRIAILDNRFSMLFLRNAAGFGKSRRYEQDGAYAPKIAEEHLSNTRSAQVRHGRELFTAQCSECHSLRGGASAGPQLRNVADRDIASEPRFEYSEALKSAGGAWSEGALARFIAKPQSFGETVAMPDPGLSKEEAAEIAAYLFELKRQDRRNRSRRHRSGEAVADTPTD